MKKAVFILTISAILMIACGSNRQHDTQSATEAISLFQNEPGDSSLYGLACDGCTDSVLVFLPYAGGDPDTFDIIDAFQHRRIFGRPHIGDELVVILNPEDSAEAYMVFNMEELKDTASPLARLFGGARRQMDRLLDKYHTMGDEVDKILAEKSGEVDELQESEDNTSGELQVGETL